MNRRFLDIALFTAMMSLTASAQHVGYSADDAGRGYIDRPYLRYEAEPDLCAGWKGEMLLPPVPYSQVPLQADASRQTALTLAADGDFVEWTADAEADGLSLRFSLPDSPDGKGRKGKLAFYAGAEKLTDIDIDSYWAWQYTQIAYASEKYPDNTPSDSKFARMRFDEVYVLLPRPVAKGEKFRIVKEDGSDVPYTVDFVELEKVPAPLAFEDIEGEKVMFDGSVALQTLINQSAGKTVFIPQGTHNLPRRLMITASNVKVVGAGMWYTTLYFNASPDNRSTYSQRGIESNASGILLEGFSMNTANNQRYFNNNSSYQAGKGLQGSLGTGSVVRNVRVDHFECGAWIADYGGTASKNLTVEYCRFRNNYADGINLCSGTTGAKVSHCSFRNNGDDDMAIWSTGNVSGDNLYEYNSADCNWRASSCAIYGGRNNKARFLHIADAMEEGLHVNGEFQGTGFSGETVVEEITLERCGDKGGTSGQHGGFWGAACPAIHIRGGWHSAVNDLSISHVDIYDSRYRAVGISSNSGKAVNNLKLNYIHIDGVADNEWGIYVDASAVGNGSYENVTARNCTEPIVGNGSSRFTFTNLGNSGVGSISDDAREADFSFRIEANNLIVSDLKAGTPVSLISADGTVAARSVASGTVTSLEIPAPGLYVIATPSAAAKIFVSK